MSRRIREHWDAKGGEKRRFATRAEAVEAAADRANRSGLRRGFDTYWCRWCKHWHYGNRRRAKHADITEIHILGSRVADCLYRENTGGERKRLEAVLAAGRAAQRRARHKRDGQPVHTGAHKPRRAA